MNELQEQFVIEARELVRQATDDLIALERDGAAPERVDRVFRAFHTLKGSAGVVDLPPMTLALHAAEDLLAAVRSGKVPASSDVIDMSLAALDQVSRWIDDFEQATALPPQAGDTARRMAERFRALLSTSAANSAPGLSAATQDRAGRQGGPDLAAPISNGGPVDGSPRGVFTIVYEPLPGCFFNGDDPLALMQQIPGLISFKAVPRAPFPALSDLDPYNCNLRLEATAEAEHDAIAKVFRLVPDQVRIDRVHLSSADGDTRVTGAGLGDPGGVADMTLVRVVLDAQIELLRMPGRVDSVAACTGAARRVAINALRSAGNAQLAAALERETAETQDVPPVLAAIERAAASLGTGVAEPRVAWAISDVRADASDRSAERTLRVSEGKIEALVDLAGELIVAKNALSHSTRALGEATGAVASLRRDEDAIERLAVELHGAILQLRMVPVAQVFRSFPRLVRDVSRQLNKNVSLVTRGENTEADKTIVDRLFEPLVHLVRNAVDHGIETPEQRRAASKPEGAAITIEALRAGDRFLVEVTDDGKGIDPLNVRRRAVERSLMPADELAALDDAHVIELIFAPGFSTAETVSDVSGRGIGMDVVRTAVERLGGRVTIASRIGAGTTVRLDMPMTIAMSRIMVVGAGGQTFGIAMDTVAETVRLTPDRINRIKNNDGFVLRDQVVPIVSLAELMKLPARPADPSSRLFLVVESGARIAAFEIDAIRDRLEAVLKPMQGLLSGARGYAGTTLLGTGQVLLVLDVKELMP